MIDAAVPDTRVEPLLEDRFASVVRPGRPLAGRTPTIAEWASAAHIVNTRRGRLTGPMDARLAEAGLGRRPAATVPTVAAALLVVRGSGLMGFAAERLHRPLVEDLGLVWVPIPLELPPLVLSLAWHARYDADPAHAWLRECVRAAVHDVATGPAVGSAR
ncbi:hypothetical protein BJF79_16895 [Actinomadura sp. CNU-125]|uniref:LysR substrate-binding domain-containing protein n=1 Tax=Actinomadura sp. CNU-125 TaxID=1904961 RepID=UPI000964AABD|nr:LysR substrate-binding domain-containing protein [Actinomadura sp. CNU-125]OLT19245.1 hypothetical protein BJF79_16895 [Actinomadura sp. CNU-125]